MTNIQLVEPHQRFQGVVELTCRRFISAVQLVPLTLALFNVGTAVTGADCATDPLAVRPTGAGASLRCLLHRLEGEATAEGLWLTSTAPNAAKDRFRVVATAVGRAATTPEVLPPTGTVSVEGRFVRFIRRGLIEEYSVSADGVRQDFVIGQKPAGSGELRLTLAVDGAAVKPQPGGALLLMHHSGRKAAYHRLRVNDATGRELPARMKVMAGDAEAVTAPSGSPLQFVLVDDTAAVYPVRIDPTFSDANWSATFGFGIVNGTVSAVAVDGAGNLYIGGEFTVVGAVAATNIAKWNGSSWSALGVGIGCDEPGTCVSALAVSGNDVYAGGAFTTAGGNAANHVARWNGSSWSALDSGIDGNVAALAVFGSDLYAGGNFTAAGGNPASAIAQWNGTNWAALSAGVNGDVRALAVSGGALYVGGGFSTAGGVAANSMARWDGGDWSALGSGLNGYANALAVSGGAVYAAGAFTAAGGSPASYVASWDGTNWSALGTGMNFWVYALAAAGGDVFAGGLFSTAGGGEAGKIARWDGGSWAPLGSGIAGGTGGLFGPFVSALAVTDTDLLAGGDFTMAGGKPASFIARAYRLPRPPLSVIRSGPEVTVSWPAAGTAGFVLEQASSLAVPASWEINNAPVTDDGTNKSVNIPAVTSPLFFRLRRP